MLQGKRLPAAAGASSRSSCSASARTSRWPAEQDATQSTQAALHGGKARNVILLLGDGMGVSEVTAARYYQYGAAGRMNMDRLPFTGFQTTWSVKPGSRRGSGRRARLTSDGTLGGGGALRGPRSQLGNTRFTAR